MRFRQVHLDFHTSGLIPEVGGQFNKQQFQNALKKGHVDSITVFSKCHHGWAYHPSKANVMHPTLKFDLLGAQLEACKEINVNAPVYLSAGFDEKEVLDHPEWLCVFPGGVEDNTFIKPHYHLLCFNTAYLEKLASQVEEVMERYDPCGIFLDICSVHPCVCGACVKSMLEKGLDPANEEDRKTHSEFVYAKYAKRMEQAVRKYSATATIFHNAGHIAHGRRDLAGYDSHLELESLPTGGWGYDHFPMTSAYARTTGMEYLGMTGKFHTSWGEFGGFKHPNALIYETSLSLACGAAISIGDQLHPGARMNESTYGLIGKAYEIVEQKEPWCRGAKNISDIAVLSCEAMFGGSRENTPNTGVCRMLLEGKHLFDFIDLEANFADYKLLILPDRITLTAELASRLDAYRQQGGKLLLTGDSGLKQDKTAFALEIGAEFAGETASFPDYLIPDFDTVNGGAEYVMYTRGNDLRNVTGEVFAHRQTSYFNRQGVRFCSHQHTPNDVHASHEPAAVMTGNTAYIGWKVFEDYATKGALILKEVVLYAIERLLGDDRLVRVTLPDRGVVTVTQQPGRKIVHLLFAHTCVRGKGIEVIEDAVPLHDVQVALRVGHAPSRVLLAPEGTALPFTYEGGRVCFTVPKMVLHQMISVED